MFVNRFYLCVTKNANSSHIAIDEDPEHFARERFQQLAAVKLAQSDFQL